MEYELNLSIKDWYVKTFPNDEIGYTLSNATFEDLNNLLESKTGDVYTLLGKYSDTVVRERCFAKLSEILKTSYDSIYYKWLNLEEDIERDI